MCVIAKQERHVPIGPNSRPIEPYAGHAFLEHVVANDSAADDVCEDTAIYTRLGSSGFSAWLTKIALNFARRRSRRRRGRVATFQDLSPQSEGATLFSTQRHGP